MLWVYSLPATPVGVYTRSVVTPTPTWVDGVSPPPPQGLKRSLQGLGWRCRGSERPQPPSPLPRHRSGRWAASSSRSSSRRGGGTVLWHTTSGGGGPPPPAVSRCGPPIFFVRKTFDCQRQCLLRRGKGCGVGGCSRRTRVRMFVCV